MKKILPFFLIFVLVLIVLWLVVFSGKKEKSEIIMKNYPQTISISKSDNGKEISANAGDVIRIEMEIPGATGYLWEVDNLDNAHLQLVSDTSAPASENTGMAGAPVIQIWEFKTIEKGPTEIKLDYFRPWEGRDTAIEHFDIKININ